MPYVIKCETPGENVLAQKILFSKGYGWSFDRSSLRMPDRGLYLVIRGKMITFLDLHQWNNRDRSSLTPINMSELMRLENV